MSDTTPVDGGDVPQVIPPKKPRRPKGYNPRPLPPSPFNLPPPVPVFEEHNGLRKVKPYMYEFQSFAKERWQGRTLIDVYSEFRDRSAEYYQWAIDTGAIVVNNKKSTADTILKNGDLISNVLHRHEPPVVAGPIRIIYDGRLPGNDGETLVVEKPGSMPVHATGRYNFNTLLGILKYDYDLPLVHTSNRLDRLTSGVMVCALTVEASKKIGAWFGGQRAAEGGVEKEYVARTIGRFPDGEIVCEEPLLTIDRQVGVNVVHPDGRHAKTIFKRMSYNQRSNTSVVHCKPITGRTHQIRVHLQYLGHPIANDPIYQNTAAWGKSGGKGGVFGSDRGGTAEDRQLRQNRGDMLMQKLKAEGVGAGFTADGDEDDEHATDSDMASGPSRYNKHGRLRGAQGQQQQQETLGSSPSPPPLPSSSTASTQSRGLPTAADLEALTAERKAHDPALTEQAKVVVAVLRDVKDEADGWARQRDLLGIEKAQQSDTGGLMGAAERVAKGQEAGIAGDGDGSMPVPGRAEDERTDRASGDSDAGFCPVCFTPSMPDPRPEQLFIWLHAMRYKTLDWDWSSPKLPEWAEDHYEVPLSSILS